MLNQIKSLNPNTLVYELDEFVTKDEIIMIDEGIQSTLSNFDEINLMICINIKRESLGALIKEFQVGLKYWNKINKIAYVADKKHWQTLVEIDNLFTKFKEKYFDVDDMDNAWKWLNK
ncbi:STAS/SEC14 domain-containing protein [Lutibacter sp.]|uniref:STAS/SEC14 domain-containing protein n=1 Tax=Lutibacter sp. TaxID=1925666 RepID=UPI0025C6D6FC|nr:STAS/SEC14 domain-containing protein [Lutibacter sp.]MCF6182349.1 STAS/SEC14 domain-containing protein [Lutibacter sp.]